MYLECRWCVNQWVNPSKMENNVRYYWRLQWTVNVLLIFGVTTDCWKVKVWLPFTMQCARDFLQFLFLYCVISFNSHLQFQIEEKKQAAADVLFQYSNFVMACIGNQVRPCDLRLHLMKVRCINDFFLLYQCHMGTISWV